VTVGASATAGLAYTQNLPGLLLSGPIENRLDQIMSAIESVNQTVLAVGAGYSPIITQINRTLVSSHDEFGIILDSINSTVALTFERNRYFYGKLMTVRDFEVEQTYFRQELVGGRLVHHVIVWTTLGAYGRVNATLSVDVLNVTNERYEVKGLSPGIYEVSISLPPGTPPGDYIVIIDSTHELTVEGQESYWIRASIIFILSQPAGVPY